jgi:hypothetical protein
MKKFKNLLNEFRGSLEPPNNFGGGGGDDNVNQVIRFMETVPYEHTTKSGHTVKFNDSKDAGLMLGSALEKHEKAWKHSRKLSGGSQTPNTRYFANSFATHVNFLDNLEDYIKNHPKLPKELKPHVTDAVNEIENKGRDVIKRIEHWGKIVAPPNQTTDMGEITYQRHKTDNPEAHPHEQNELHHIQDIMNEIQEDPDRGYVIRKEEM